VSDETAPTIDGRRLRVMLQDAGWRVTGEREGLYVRLAPDSEYMGPQGSLLIPTNPDSADYAELLMEALHLLRTSSGDLWSRLLLPQLSTVPTDAFRFRKESAAPKGLIPWEEGETLINSARATLIAGAKSYMEPVRYFNNKFGQFANRYLDTILMGQTGVGSYVVTAYAPVQSRVALKGGKADPLGYEGVDVAAGRAVTTAVVDALEAAVGALEEARTTGQIEPFEQAVEQGVSYELLTAVSMLVEGADEAEVSVEWDRSVLLDTMARTSSSFAFRGSDAQILHQAATALVTPEPPRQHSADGWVHLLSKKEAGGPGVFGVDSGKRKYRVRLQNESDLYIATNAWEEDAHVRVTGMLSTEGNINWLYGATVVKLEPADANKNAPPNGRKRADTIPLF
jgi:hypothetical protein